MFQPTGGSVFTVKHWRGTLNLWHPSFSSWPSWLSWFVRMRQTWQRSMIPASEMMAQIYEKTEEIVVIFVVVVVEWPPRHKELCVYLYVLRSKTMGSPFVEGRRPFFSHHGPGAVDGALVLTWWWVHVSCFHHIYWGSNDGGDEAGAKCRYKVTRQIVCGESWKQSGVRMLVSSIETSVKHVIHADDGSDLDNYCIWSIEKSEYTAYYTDMQCLNKFIGPPVLKWNKRVK